MNTPVEIWLDIIDHILFDPISYLTDPFYPGCNLHTAVDQWTDNKRLRNLEFQRGTLRLVSRFWKNVVDARPWTYFEPYRYKKLVVGDPRGQLEHSRRLEFYEPCKDHILGSEPFGCCQCLEGISATTHDTSLFVDLDKSKFKVTILRLPLWGHCGQYLEASQERVGEIFPHLRALFISINRAPKSGLLPLFENLTFLSMRLERSAGWPRAAAEPYCLPAVQTLQIEVTNNFSFEFWKYWDMPSLVHLILSSTSPLGLLVPLDAILANLGTNLISLRIYSREGYLLLPNDIWEMVPRLEYLGTSALNRSESVALLESSGPPSDHPLRTFGIVEVPSMYTAREDADLIAQNWQALSVIADSHLWGDMPKDYSSELDTLSHPHMHIYDFCWMCFAVLHETCKQLGLRYEDRTGKTWEEFQAENLAVN
ncbi:hypothetical protein M408DRAFT_331392 [Serendipita vermifera MAFF 305830]|uniref:F-box domain-containing protein n=1 Tax=Serendipita vermifera MAFF 305830 TaxID=933852 RepID=A0A0C3B0Q1_SERVB|nr:hypothetical protein M408DRAFT_331392 [Serendipita vermifera MAFF 305830]